MPPPGQTDRLRSDGCVTAATDAAESAGSSVSHDCCGRGRRARRAPPHQRGYVKEISSLYVVCRTGKMADARKCKPAAEAEEVIRCEICQHAVKSERATRRHTHIVHRCDYKRNEPL